MSITVLITGANRGIGLALTREFLSRGHRVIATARSPETATDLNALSGKCGGRLAIHRADVTDARSIAALRERLVRSNTSIDVLVNNAAIFPEQRDIPFAELSMDDMDAALQTNVTGVARVTQALIPLIPANGNGRIVNISSGAGLIGVKNNSQHYCYGPSKAALNMLTRTLAAELGPKGIVVTAVNPGWVKTDMGGPDARISTDESAKRLVSNILGLKPEHNGAYLGFDGQPDPNAW